VTTLALVVVGVLAVFVLAVVVLWLLGAWRAKPARVAVLESRGPREAVQRATEDRA
jgi:hypothetical protein